MIKYNDSGQIKFFYDKYRIKQLVYIIIDDLDLQHRLKVIYFLSRIGFTIPINRGTLNYATTVTVIRDSPFVGYLSIEYVGRIGEGYYITSEEAEWICRGFYANLKSSYLSVDMVGTTR